MRKLIAFDPETWTALDLLAKDRMATIQELADEAFVDLLKKHNRPTTLKEALKQSARRLPANDPGDGHEEEKATARKSTPTRRPTVRRKKRR